jgi:outer membrane immunogenic protein
VFGVEGDVDWQRWSRNTVLGGTLPAIFVPNDSFSWSSRWEASARGRIGYAWDRWMLYVTGGAAFTNVNVNTNFIAFGVFPASFASASQTVWGPTVGAGFEYAFWNNWSFGVEGRYSWYGTKNYNGGVLATIFTPATGAFTFAPVTQSVKLETFEVMAKLNFKIF